MRKLFLTMIGTAAIFSAVNCNAQLYTLSPRNIDKLNRITAGKERILKYHSLLKRDSIKHERILKKTFKKAVDSATLPEKYLRKLQRRALDRWRKVVIKDSFNKFPDAVSTSAEEGIPASLDSAADKLKRLKELDRGGNFNLPDTLPDKMGNAIDVKSLRANLDPSTMLNVTSISENGTFPQTLLGERKLSAGPIGRVTKSYGDVSRTFEQWREDGVDLRNANTLDVSDEKLGDKLQTKIADKLLAAQRRVAKLLSRYQSFTSSGDSLSGIKKNCLQGRPLKERIFLGPNITPLSVNPMSLDISPQLGYKINKRFVVGASLRQRIVFSDTISSNEKFISRQLAYSAFTSMTLWKSWFGFAEADFRPGESGPETRKRPRRIGCAAGIGKRFLVHPKLYFNLTMVYRLAEANEVAGEPKLQCRLGVSLSELAIRRKSTFYNPNR